MSWLSIHRNRHNINGLSIKEAHLKNTETFINEGFADSPSYCIVKVKNVDVEARWITDKKYSSNIGYEVKKLLLRPKTVINRGDYIVKDKEVWLTMFYSDNSVSPYAIAMFCNQSLSYGENTYPCVFNSGVGQSQKINEGTQLLLPSDSAIVYVSSNTDTLNTKRLDRFVIDEQAWEVQAIDRTTTVLNGEGVISITVKKVPLKDEEVTENIPPVEIEKDSNDWEWS